MEKKFYDDNLQGWEIPKGVVDDSTTFLSIETPEGWKCERPNCPIDYLHKHGTYPSLATNSNK